MNGKITYKLEITCEDDEGAWWKPVKVIEQDSEGKPDTFDILHSLDDYRKENHKYCSGRVVRESIEIVATSI